MKPNCLILVLSYLLTISRAVCGAEPDLTQRLNQYLVQHHYVAVKLSSGGVNTELVRVEINNKKVDLVVDTGSPYTGLTYDCARHLRLPLHDLGQHWIGLGGEIRGDESLALMNSFRVSAYDINRTNTIHVLSRDAEMGDGDDGLFGLDFLLLNSAIYPVGSYVMLLKPGPTPPADIRGYMKAMGFTEVPLSFDRGHLCVEGHLNGKALHLYIDSGAYVSNFRATAIKAAMGDDLLSTQLYSEGLDGRRDTQFQFTPRVIDIGGFPVAHETLLASDAASFEKGNFDGLVGVDLLGTHHAIIDLGDRVLWLK